MEKTADFSRPSKSQVECARYWIRSCNDICKQHGITPDRADEVLAEGDLDSYRRALEILAAYKYGWKNRIK